MVLVLLFIVLFSGLVHVSDVSGTAKAGYWTFLVICLGLVALYNFLMMS